MPGQFRPINDPCGALRSFSGVLWLVAAPVFGAELAGTVEVSGRPAQNAVVWLEATGAPAAHEQKVVLDQRNLAFAPQVMVVRVGTTVDFPNNDKVFHNVFSFRDGKKFDLGMYPNGSAKRIVFDKPGLARLFCNIHPNMAAYVMAVDTPYFAVSNESGAFTIAGVPARHIHLSRMAPGRSAADGLDHGRWRTHSGSPLVDALARVHLRRARRCSPRAPAQAQNTIATEIDLTTGYSGEDIRATAALQLRLFGEAPGRHRLSLPTPRGEIAGQATRRSSATFPRASIPSAPTYSVRRIRTADECS